MPQRPPAPANPTPPGAASRRVWGAWWSRRCLPPTAPAGWSSRGCPSPPPATRHGSRRTRSCDDGLSWQTEAALADDRALDFVGSAGNGPLPRADEVEHPDAGLPAAGKRLQQFRVGGEAADLGAEVGHALQELAVTDLDDG